MTHTDYTKNILNIKDKNVFFNENCLETKTIKGVETKVFHGYLTYDVPEYCPICGSINNNSIIKWAFKKNCKIKLDKVSNYNTILLLKSIHPWASFPPWRHFASVNVALLRLPPLSLARTENPSQTCIDFRTRTV